MLLFRSCLPSRPSLGHVEATVLGWVGVDEVVEERRESDELTALQRVRNVKDCLYKVRYIHTKIT